jgi:diadenosine tetraphosphate (Ap4A) HIT family hydrolase
MPDYSKNIVKKYNFWTVYVHTNQEYLGRCVIWCNREDAQDLTETTPEELQEFSQIIRELKTVIEKSFHPDWINYSFLGNADRHLHCHMVPRYASKQVFAGVTFKDKRWGHNWLLDESYVTPPTMLQAIKVKLQNNFV